MTPGPTTTDTVLLAVTETAVGTGEAAETVTMNIAVTEEAETGETGMMSMVVDVVAEGEVEKIGTTEGIGMVVEEEVVVEERIGMVEGVVDEEGIMIGRDIRCCIIRTPYPSSSLYLGTFPYSAFLRPFGFGYFLCPTSLQLYFSFPSFYCCRHAIHTLLSLSILSK